MAAKTTKMQGKCSAIASGMTVVWGPILFKTSSQERSAVQFTYTWDDIRWDWTESESPELAYCVQWEADWQGDQDYIQCLAFDYSGPEVQTRWRTRS